MRLVLIPLLLSLLTACGYAPIHNAQDNAASLNLSQIHIKTIPDVNGQALRNALLDRITPKGEPTKPAYELYVTLRSEERALGLRRDATATRSQLQLTAEFRLIDLATQQVLLESSSRTFVSHDILQAQYGTLVAARDAVERGVKDIAQDIATRLSLVLKEPTGLVSDRPNPAPFIPALPRAQ